MEGFNWSILGWIGGLVFVYIFGLFEGRSQGRKQRIAEESQEKKDEPALQQPVKVDDPGLLRIKNENGTMTLDLEGKRVEPTALTADQRKRLIEMLNTMRPWLEGKPAPAVSTPPSAPMPAPAPITSPPSKPSSPPPSASLITPKKKKDEPEVPPTSIVGQINLILQARIINTPLASRGVSLLESTTGGVNVYVGINRYEGVDAVPDEEIKTAIREAITEWENKYTPGLS